ncbi:MAG: queuosine precursor transporter [Defluviitaleaceae bacterium]|nr:queuosine precursor transporter [Defluviitaleaceae bacterium]
MKSSPLLMYLSVMFVAVLVISNVIANHMIQLGPFSVDAGTLTFPVTYILSDVISEVYGYKWSRRIAWTALGLNAAFALLIILIVRLPQPEWYDGIYFANALSNSWRIVIASLLAFCIGDLVDDRIFRYFREKNRVKYEGKENMRGFAFRALISSLAGHIIDSNIFVFIAFAPVVFLADTGIPWYALPGMILVNILLKWGYEWAVIPITYRVTKWVGTKEDNFADK